MRVITEDAFVASRFKLNLSDGRLQLFLKPLVLLHICLKGVERLEFEVCKEIRT